MAWFPINSLRELEALISTRMLKSVRGEVYLGECHVVLRDTQRANGLQAIMISMNAVPEVRFITLLSHLAITLSTRSTAWLRFGAPASWPPNWNTEVLPGHQGHPHSYPSQLPPDDDEESLPPWEDIHGEDDGEMGERASYYGEDVEDDDSESTLSWGATMCPSESDGDIRSVAGSEGYETDYSLERPPPPPPPVFWCPVYQRLWVWYGGESAAWLEDTVAI
jgi:hypothetical protein